MSKNKLAGIVAVLIIAIIAVVAVVSPQPDSEELDPPGGPAEFLLSNLTVSPAEVEPEESVTVTVQVQNAGEEQGTYQLELKPGGVVGQLEMLVRGALTVNRR